MQNNTAPDRDLTETSYPTEDNMPHSSTQSSYNDSQQSTHNITDNFDKEFAQDHKDEAILRPSISKYKYSQPLCSKPIIRIRDRF